MLNSDPQGRDFLSAPNTHVWFSFLLLLLLLLLLFFFFFVFFFVFFCIPFDFEYFILNVALISVFNNVDVGLFITSL